MNGIPSSRSIGKGAFWSTVNQLSRQFIVLAVFLVTARFVAKEDFGTMAICMVVIEFFRSVSVDSIGNSLTAWKISDEKDYDSAFYLILIGTVVSFFIMFGLAYPFALLFKNPSLEHSIHLTSFILITSGISKTFEVWMAKNYNFKALALRSLIALSAGGACGVYLAVMGYGLYALIAQQIVASVAAFALLFVTCDWRPSKKFDLNRIQRFWGFSKHVTSNSFLSFASSQADVFFTAYFLGPLSTGVLNAGKRISTALDSATSSAINAVCLPILSHVSDSEQDLRTFFLRSVTYTALLTIPMYVGLAILSADMVEVILGSKWIDVAPVLSVLALGSMLWSIDQYNSNIYLVVKRPHWLTIQTAAHVVLNIIILLSIARYGVVWVAVGLLIKASISFIVSLTLSLRLVKAGLRDYLLALSPIILSASVMGSGLAWLRYLMSGAPPLLVLSILVPLGVAIYFISLFLLKREFALEIVKNILAVLERR